MFPGGLVVNLLLCYRFCIHMLYMLTPNCNSSLVSHVGNWTANNELIVLLFIVVSTSILMHMHAVYTRSIRDSVSSVMAPV